MPEAIIFADAHVSEDAPESVERLVSFLSGPASRAKRVFILGDLFDFWFGPKQAAEPAYARVLGAIGRLAGSGVEVTFYHGNRDFYVSAAFGARYGFGVVEDFSIESVCGRRLLLCHGDMLCANDVRYHRMRAVVRNPLTRAILTHLPAGAARAMARFYRRASRREVAAKPQWVLGIDDRAALAHFAHGADAIVCGHTHRENVREFETPEGRKTLYALGDFGVEGSYIECEAGVLAHRRFEPGETGSRGLDAAGIP